MPATEQRQWTAREVRDLIARNPLHTPRYELVDGELLVTSSPNSPHAFGVMGLIRALDAYTIANPIGKVLTSPSDVELLPGTIVQPDVYVVPPREIARLRAEGDPCREILLAIEILSPSSMRHDRVTKRRLYQRAGVGEYWIVDLDARLFERWRPGDERPEIIDTALEWHPAGAAAPFVLPLGAFFAEVLGE